MSGSCNYKILGLEPGADRGQLRKAYRRLAMRWHPDRFAQDPGEQEFAVRRMQRLNAAYDQLVRNPASVLPEVRVRPEAPSTPEPRRKTGHYWSHRWAMAMLLLASAILMLGHLQDYLAKRQTPPFVGVSQGAEPLYEDVAAWSEPGEVVIPVAEPREVALVRGQDGVFFQLGSTRKEVVMAQGEPTEEEGGRLHFGTSHVRLVDGRVASWVGGEPRLKVLMLADRSTRKQRFGIGSTADEVLSIHGTPGSFTPGVFCYGTSLIAFARGAGPLRDLRVVSWESGDVALSTIGFSPILEED